MKKNKTKMVGCPSDLLLAHSFVHLIMFEHHTQMTLTYTILKTVIYISIHVHVYPSKVKCKIKPFLEAIGR